MNGNFFSIAMQKKKGRFREMKPHQSFNNFSLTLMLLTVVHANVHAQQPAATGKAVSANVSNAQAKSEPLIVTLARQKVILSDGKESLHSAEVARPGDILEEVATYSNRSSAPLKSLQATLPIPPSTELLIASIKPTGAKASLDGNEFSNLPLKRRVKQANGVEIELAVPISEYRYLRWYPGELLPGKSLVFTARFKVSNDSIPAGK